MKQIKTLADFKRAVEVGAKVHTIWHTAFAGRDENQQPIWKDEDRGIREVSIKQSNSFALKTENDGKVVDSWCSWPKATECRIVDNQVTILAEDFRVREGQKPMIPVLTYSVL